MSDKCDGGSAFPGQRLRESAAQGVLVDATPGMTLRDWFAGQALAGLVAHCPIAADKAAMCCWQFADAMLAEREKGGE